MRYLMVNLNDASSTGSIVYNKNAYTVATVVPTVGLLRPHSYYFHSISSAFLSSIGSLYRPSLCCVSRYIGNN